MLPARIQYLLKRYFDHTATPAERVELAQWIDGADDESLQTALGESWEMHVPLTQMPDDMSDRIVSSLFATEARPRYRVFRYAWWAAASLLLVAAAGWWWQQQRPPVASPAPVAGKEQRYKNEVAPGGNHALLTLANGAVIVLDSAANGVLAQQGNVIITKRANGELTYEGNGNGKPLYNTMTTPRGGQYHLLLPDGTGVWLNAASSIAFPAAFTGEDRSVSITGEVYFEVAANPDKPFKVKAGATDITVMGTRFNVNAYSGESSTRTTLVEGAVSVSAGNTRMVLKPGQQAQVHGNDQLSLINHVDTDEIIAWKNGFFQFTDADMPTVMRQIEQWYDVKVIYEGDIPERSFGGAIQRSLPLSEVLTILEENNVKFKIEGKNITVLK
ncbi:FecR family protein [Chitinophaga polysaccharea]|uniref:FecR family protein n=1 Tax=Chitinophaga polysaccharea TaxID=1293035 RepID=A0A561PCE2_9BACT|nr:FecR family protein [Chitinophaga polysaccharea]TWF35792.1 FecR family protein [Chitinophaga polysaccharea]